MLLFCHAVVLGRKTYTRKKRKKLTILCSRAFFDLDTHYQGITCTQQQYYKVYVKHIISKNKYHFQALHARKYLRNTGKSFMLNNSESWVKSAYFRTFTINLQQHESQDEKNCRNLSLQCNLDPGETYCLNKLKLHNITCV